MVQAALDLTGQMDPVLLPAMLHMLSHTLLRTALVAVAVQVAAEAAAKVVTVLPEEVATHQAAVRAGPGWGRQHHPARRHQATQHQPRHLLQWHHLSHRLLSSALALCSR